MTEPTPKIQGLIRQYKRILLSYADFKHAILAARYILEKRLHAKYPQQSYIILEALSCSMIMAYTRPFSGNDNNSNPKIPDLSERFLSVLDEDEREMHEVALHDRNKLLAHSDSDALDVEPVVFRVMEIDTVAPIKNWGLAPLTEEATRSLKSAAEKLQKAIFEERMRLEPQLLPYFRVAGPEDLFDPPERGATQPVAKADGTSGG